MEDELILKQPIDRRLVGDVNSLPPGPPGVENDTADYDAKSKIPSTTKDVVHSSATKSRRRSPSDSSPPSKRKSPSRGPRSPPRGRRTPSPRNRRYGRDYSPDRRRYGGRNDIRMRRSPDRMRNRSPRDRDPRRGGRASDRYRARRNSPSRSRSPSPQRGRGRWSPKKKPNSPPAPPPPSLNTNAQYAVAPNLYTDPYATYNQYGPLPQAFAHADFVAAPPPAFNAAYPPPPTWGVPVTAGYGQQNWVQPPPQAEAVLPIQIQQQRPNQQMPEPIQLQPLQQPTQQIPQQPPQQQQQQQTQQQQQQVLPTPVLIPKKDIPVAVTIEPTNSAHDAVAQEAENQRDELKKQRASYLKKTASLRKELKLLKDQRKDLVSDDGPSSPTTKGFLDENDKLQNQIQKKLSTIENVIDMLTGIIGEENLDKDNDEDEGNTFSIIQSKKSSSSSAAGSTSGAGNNNNKKKRSTSSSSSSNESSSSSTSTTDSSSSSTSDDDDDDSSPERLKTKVIESMKSKQREANKKQQLIEKEEVKKLEDAKKRINYIFYDPEMHWCQNCSVFPKTAKDYLNHMHSKEHLLSTKDIESPWHFEKPNDEYPSYENAQTKRTPIRGLNFFVPALAWYCKLCSAWMGDLHCASTHLKSQTHSNKYNSFLEKNPHFEVDWLAERQRVLNEKKSAPPPPQITSVSTTDAENVNVSNKKLKKDEEKTKDKSASKKRKKKSSDKKEKKKKKRSKKRKKAATSSSSASSSDTASENEKEKEKEKLIKYPIKELNNANPAASIRVAMRNQILKTDEDEAPPPPAISQRTGAATRWSAAPQLLTEGPAAIATSVAAAAVIEENKKDDSLISQWNTVQPVISESEKKLLEQLKGKLKNKPVREEPIRPVPPPTIAPPPATAAIAKASEQPTESGKKVDASNHSSKQESGKENQLGRSLSKKDGRGGGGRDDERNYDRRRDVSGGRGRGGRSRSPRYGSRRGNSRSRSRGRYRRSRSRGGRRRSRGRYSPVDYGRKRRSRSMRRRSRSHGRHRRGSTSRSRSRSSSDHRIEKPIVRQPEFRPRVPENKKLSKIKDEKEERKKANLTSAATAAKTAAAAAAAAASGGKKLPFIGRMPVFKKQSQNSESDKKDDDDENGENMSAYGHNLPHDQMHMAMMQDPYGNPLPYDPMMDYDDLMPDPVQFVSLMGAPPPPPASQHPSNFPDDDKDILPPGIDETESEFVPKPISDAPIARKGPLPKDFEEALNIIFPGEKKPEEIEAERLAAAAKAAGETHVITDEPVMQQSDLAKEGIHLMTVEEASLAAADDGSQMSMNEPLVFNKPSKFQHEIKRDPIEEVCSDVVKSVHDKQQQKLKSSKSPSKEEPSAVVLDISDIPHPPLPQLKKETKKENKKESRKEAKKDAKKEMRKEVKKETKQQKELLKTEAETKKEIKLDEIMLDIPTPTEIAQIPPPSEISHHITNKAVSPLPVASVKIPNPNSPKTNGATKIVPEINSADVYELDDIPQPPPSPTESEKNRRQEELDDLMMLGIDADDMAAQCM